MGRRSASPNARVSTSRFGLPRCWVPVFLLWGMLGSGLVPTPLSAQPLVVISCPRPEGITGDLRHPMAAVRYLADDLLEGRLSGTVGERCAAEYIAREFARIGLLPGGMGTGAIGGGYLLPVSLRSAVNQHAPEGVGMNVVGILPGSDPTLREEAIVIGAHHDHLGRGEFFGSLATADDPPGSIHNGADDNASGVGVLLAVAEALAQAPPLARSVLFVTFTGEELGLLGSAAFVEQSPLPPGRIVAMLNMDMVGRLEGRPLIVNGTGTAEEWGAILDAVEGEIGIELLRAPEGFGPSDHTSFYIRDIPVLHLFTNVHAQYHRPDDSWELVDQEGMDRVAEVVLRITEEVANAPSRLTVIPGVGAPSGNVTGGDRAYLGTVPDFAPVEFGVRLSGVTAGSPGALAGLEAGDILVGLGSFVLADLYALTEALERLAPGTEVEAVVLRGGRELRFQVLLGSR